MVKINYNPRKSTFLNRGFGIRICFGVSSGTMFAHLQRASLRDLTSVHVGAHILSLFCLIVLGLFLLHDSLDTFCHGRWCSTDRICHVEILQFFLFDIERFAVHISLNHLKDQIICMITILWYIVYKLILGEKNSKTSKNLH